MSFIILLIPFLYCMNKTNINKEIIFYGIAFYFIYHLYQKNRIEGLFGVDVDPCSMDIVPDFAREECNELVDAAESLGQEAYCFTTHEAALTSSDINMIPLYDATANCKILRYNFDQKWLSENPDCRPYVNSASDCSNCVYVDTEGADDEGTCRPNIIQFYNDIVTNCESITDEQECINHKEKDGANNNIMNICDWVTINEEDKCIYTLDPSSDYLEHLCEESMTPPDCPSLSQEDCESNQLCEYTDDTCSSIAIDQQTGNSTVMKNICESTDLNVEDKTCSYKLNCTDEGEEHICLYDYLGVGTVGSEYDEESTNSPCYVGSEVSEDPEENNSENNPENNSENNPENNSENNPPPIDCTSIQVEQDCIGDCTWENDTCS